MPKLTSDVTDDVIIFKFFDCIDNFLFLALIFKKLFQNCILVMLCACTLVASTMMSSMTSTIFILLKKSSILQFLDIFCICSF